MYVVKQSEYEADKSEFFRRHSNDYTLEQSGNSAEYYRKTYIFADGAQWFEVMMKTTVEEVVDIKLCHVKVFVDMLQTEYWTTDTSGSKFYYEQWDTSK